MARHKQRPIDVQDAPWSHIGKDELDKAAETVWNTLRDAGQLHTTRGDDMGPYHVQSSVSQASAQRAVLALLGTTVPAMLRERARDYPETGDTLTDFAEELEEEHGV